MAKEVKVKMKNGTEKHSEFKSFISVTKMQLKNKVDLSWTKSVKSVIRVVILTLLKSIIVGALAFVMLYILNLLGIYRAWNIYQVVIVILSLSLILSLIPSIAEVIDIIPPLSSMTSLLASVIKSSIVLVASLYSSLELMKSE